MPVPDPDASGVPNEKLATLAKLISDLAHEINNPLMVISGRAELSLMDSKADEKIKANQKTIIGQCTRIKQMIQKLLIFSRSSKGEVSAVDIHAELEAVLNDPGPEPCPEGIRVTKNFDPSLPRVEVNGPMMKQVFENLIVNAFEAMPGGGELTIATSGEGGQVRIDFQDTGRGIDPEHQAKIFDPFFTNKDEQAGLGLSVCYGIVRAHGGQLTYDSAPGRGTTATLVLPVGEGGDG